MGRTPQLSSAKPATSLDCNWRSNGGEEKTAYHLKYPLSQDTYRDYVVGKTRMNFAGFRDWRLPTVEELWTLFQAGVADESFFRGQIWTANPSTKGFLATFGMSYPASWMFEGYIPEAFGDMKRTLLYPIRLVRAGTIFDSRRSSA